MEAVKHWPPLGRAVHSPLHPASWVKLCPSRCPPLCPICEITIRHWDLLRKLLGVYATSGAWLALLPQGLLIKGKWPVGAIAADSAFKEAGLDLFSCC